MDEMMDLWTAFFECMGLEFIGIGIGGLILFNDPRTDSTLAIMPDEMTYDALISKIEKSRAQFAIQTRRP